MLGSLASLYVAGQQIDWDRVYPSGRSISLPLYQWQRRRFWLEAPPEGEALSWSPALRPQGLRGRPLLGAHLQSSVQQATHFWETEVSLATLPWLRIHRYRLGVDACCSLRGHGSAGAEALRSDQLVVEGLEFQRPLVVAEDQSEPCRRSTRPQDERDSDFSASGPGHLSAYDWSRPIDGRPR